MLCVKTFVALFGSLYLAKIAFLSFKASLYRTKASCNSSGVFSSFSIVSKTEVNSPSKNDSENPTEVLSLIKSIKSSLVTSGSFSIASKSCMNFSVTPEGLEVF